MKWTLAIVALVLGGIFAGALYMRSLDPRPANAAMQEQLAAALDGMKTGTADPVTQEQLAESYTALARTVANIGLAYGQDTDMLAYARHVIDRPALQLARQVPAAELTTLHRDLLVGLDLAVAHVGTPDDRLFEFMLPLERAMAELGRLGDSKMPASALRASDPATLMAASAAYALEGWGRGSGHTH